jgi:hypothetical protein
MDDYDSFDTPSIVPILKPDSNIIDYKTHSEELFESLIQAKKKIEILEEQMGEIDWHQRKIKELELLQKDTKSTVTTLEEKVTQ